MIEIRLTDTDALEYLKIQSPDTAALAKALETATQYIDVLEKEKSTISAAINNDDPMRHNIAGNMNKPAHHQQHEEIVSPRILRDTEIANEVEPVIDRTATRWSEQEVKVINYAMSRQAIELNRKFSVLCEKLDRTENSVRSKLSEMGIYVNSDTLYHK